MESKCVAGVCSATLSVVKRDVGQVYFLKCKEVKRWEKRAYKCL